MLKILFCKQTQNKQIFILKKRKGTLYKTEVEKFNKYVYKKFWLVVTSDSWQLA